MEFRRRSKRQEGRGRGKRVEAFNSATPKLERRQRPPKTHTRNRPFVAHGKRVGHPAMKGRRIETEKAGAGLPLRVWVWMRRGGKAAARLPHSKV